MNDFTQFQRWFKHYQEKFGLLGWKVYFKYEPIDGYFADTTFKLGDMVATVRLNSEDKDNPNKDVKRSAKHEALHLMIGRLENNGRARYISSDEIYETAEELVHKLEELIE